MRIKYLIFLVIILFLVIDVKPTNISYVDLYKEEIEVEVISHGETTIYQTRYGITISEFLKENNLKSENFLNETYVLVNHDVLNLDNTNKISINLITYEELVEIPYISAKNAKAIIEYRDNNGFFKTIDEVKNVQGIGESKLKILKEYLSI